MKRMRFAPTDTSPVKEAVALPLLAVAVAVEAEVVVAVLHLPEPVAEAEVEAATHLLQALAVAEVVLLWSVLVSVRGSSSALEEAVSWVAAV